MNIPTIPVNYNILDSESRTVDDSYTAATTKHIVVSNWRIEHDFQETVSRNSSSLTSTSSWLFANFKHYPLLSLCMLIPFLMSLTLLLAYWFYSALTIHPGILAWSSVGFGGMYVVLISASKEIDEAKAKK